MSIVTKRSGLCSSVTIVVLSVCSLSGVRTVHAGDPTISMAQEDTAAVKTVEFTVHGMTCGTCANSATGALKKAGGVHQARVDFDTRTGSVEADSSLTNGQIRAALATLGFEAQFPDDPPPPERLSEAVKATLDIRTISHGVAIHVESHIAPGKYTLFDYYADWCGPCRLLTPKLERLVRGNISVALREVDISNWKSEAARQATREFGLSALPYVRIYGTDGRFLGEVTGNRFNEIVSLIEQNNDTELEE